MPPASSTTARGLASPGIAAVDTRCSSSSPNSEAGASDLNADETRGPLLAKHNLTVASQCLVWPDVLLTWDVGGWKMLGAAHRLSLLAPRLAPRQGRLDVRLAGPGGPDRGYPWAGLPASRAAITAFCSPSTARHDLGPDHLRMRQL